MRLYNTETGALEPFQVAGRPVRLYGCGIRPYDTTHLGYAFTYAVVDVLVRYLESHQMTVRYVQNVTDLDDDILRKAAEIGADWPAQRLLCRLADVFGLRLGVDGVENRVVEGWNAHLERFGPAERIESLTR
jgi:cysteinyl-tRNA synthetase